MPAPRQIGHAIDIPDPEGRYCQCCKKRLKGRLAWLELDQRTDRYHDFGGVPENKSQGWFPFGIACARRLLAEAAAAEK